MIHRYDDIPKLFYSEETDEPFRSCVDCGCSLLVGELDYSIQKMFVRDEAVFEYALCRACTERLREELSQETMLAYQSFLFSTADLSNRIGLMQDPEAHEFSEWVESCLVCHKPRSECHRFSISGMFSGASLVLAEFPAMVCDDCEQEMGQLTSKETQDRWNRFVEENFDGPPGVEADSPYSQPILF